VTKGRTITAPQCTTAIVELVRLQIPGVLKLTELQWNATGYHCQTVVAQGVKVDFATVRGNRAVIKGVELLQGSRDVVNQRLAPGV